MPPSLVGELGVALPARREATMSCGTSRSSARRRVLDLAGFRPQRDLAHMGDVEQAGGAARMQMLLQHAGRILHRHLIAGEGNHLAAARDMERV